MLNEVHFIIVGVTILTLLLAVTLHYEAFIRLSAWLERSGRRGRQRILIMVLALILVHAVEISLFATAAWVLLEYVADSGSITAPYTVMFLDYIYLSSVTFTTLGFGEIYPNGPIRFLYGTEALSGFALITWSASLTFIEMQRHWLGSQK